MQDQIGNPKIQKVSAKLVNRGLSPEHAAQVAEALVAIVEARRVRDIWAETLGRAGRGERNGNGLHGLQAG